MSLGTSVLVGQSGGPTAAINASLAGVVVAARTAGFHAVGMRYGIQGLLDGRTVDLDEQLAGPAQLELLSHTPSSYLGSCRYKLPDPSADETPYHTLFKRFSELDARAVLYIGGNDSMDTIAKLSCYGEATGSKIRFVGVPKTIDNDLILTDHTPGYGSAAKFIAVTVDELACDADVYDLAAWCAVNELSERSARNRSAAVDIPDFTRGAWRTNAPMEIVDIDLSKMGFETAAKQG